MWTEQDSQVRVTQGECLNIFIWISLYDILCKKLIFLYIIYIRGTYLFLKWPGQNDLPVLKNAQYILLLYVLSILYKYNIYVHIHCITYSIIQWNTFMATKDILYK